MSTPTETPVFAKKNHPILLRLPETLHVRLSSAAERTTHGRQDIIRAGLVAELDRLEAQCAFVPATLAAQIAEAQALGLNVERVLANAIAAQSRAAQSVIQRDPFPHHD